MSTAWILLIIAGLFEVGWAVGLKYTDGFTKLTPSLLVGVSLAVSMYLLSVAARSIPIGTAYGIWVGIGAIGAAILGVVLFKEPLSLARGAFLAMLLASLVGLKLTSGVE